MSKNKTMWSGPFTDRVELKRPGEDHIYRMKNWLASAILNPGEALESQTILVLKTYALKLLSAVLVALKSGVEEGIDSIAYLEDTIRNIEQGGLGK